MSGHQLTFDDLLEELSGELSASASVPLKIGLPVNIDFDQFSELEKLQHCFEEYFYSHTFFPEENDGGRFCVLDEAVRSNGGDGDSVVERLKYLATRARDVRPSLRGALYCEYCWQARQHAALNAPQELVQRAIAGYLRFIQSCSQSHHIRLLSTALRRAAHLDGLLEGHRGSEISAAFDQLAVGPISLERLQHLASLCAMLCNARISLHPQTVQEIFLTLVTMVNTSERALETRQQCARSALEIDASTDLSKFIRPNVQRLLQTVHEVLQ